MKLGLIMAALVRNSHRLIGIVLFIHEQDLNVTIDECGSGAQKWQWSAKWRRTNEL